ARVARVPPSVRPTEGGRGALGARRPPALIVDRLPSAGGARVHRVAGVPVPHGPGAAAGAAGAGQRGVRTAAIWTAWATSRSLASQAETATSIRSPPTSVAFIRTRTGPGAGRRRM